MSYLDLLKLASPQATVVITPLAALAIGPPKARGAGMSAAAHAADRWWGKSRHGRQEGEGTGQYSAGQATMGTAGKGRGGGKDLVTS